MISTLIIGIVLLYFVSVLLNWLFTSLQQHSVDQQKKIKKEKRVTQIPYQQPVQKKSPLKPASVSQPPKTTREKVKKKKKTIQTDRKALRQALIMSEVLKKPKGL